MAIVYEKLLALKIPEVEHTYGPKDCILYALGLGLGQDPMNEDELAFVYEKNLKALPTFALVQGYTPYWLRNPDSGVNWTKVVHGEQGFMLHKPVTPQGTVIGRTRIVEVIDKGEGKGALVYSERQVIDKASGELLATLDADHVLPRRRRLRRSAARGAGAACAAGARAGHRLRPADAAGNGADLPAVRRHQSAACRAGVRQGGRLSAPDSARACHLRRRRPRSAQDRVRLRSGAAHRDGRAASRRRSFRARPSAPRSGATAAW